MESVSNWQVVAVIVSTVAAAVTAWMAVETRRMATSANKALELERMPILGLNDLEIEVFHKSSESGQGNIALTGIRVGLVLFNAGRVPVRYKMNSLSVSFANRVPDSEHYLSRQGGVLPGSSTVFWHSGIPLDPSVEDFPCKGRMVVDCEYSDDSGSNPKPLKETIEFSVNDTGSGFQTKWLHVDDSGSV